MDYPKLMEFLSNRMRKIQFRERDEEEFVLFKNRNLTIEAGLLKNSAGTFIDLPDVSEVGPLNQERNYRFPSLERRRLFIFEKYGIEIARWTLIHENKLKENEKWNFKIKPYFQCIQLKFQ